MVNPASSGWSPWTNPKIVLYHGTVETAVASVLKGVTVGASSPERDFGCGFYTTTSLNQARDWAHRKSRKTLGRPLPRIIKLEVDRKPLGELFTLAFARGGKDAHHYWSFVRHCRKGLGHSGAGSAYYDVVYGPVAYLWEEPLRFGVFENHDQISFHTKAAETLLNSCKREVVK